LIVAEHREFLSQKQQELSW